MKKTIFVLLLFLGFSCSQSKPNGLILNVQFQTGKTYTISTIRGTETVVTYSGQAIAMRKLKSMKVKNPTISKLRTKTETELEIGKATGEPVCPIRLTYKKTMSLDGKNVIPEGTIVKGELDREHQLVFKSVEATDLGMDQRINLLQSLQKSFEQFRFPEVQLKLGDTLSLKRPVTMAMEGSEIEIMVNSIYKLLSFQKNIAQFEFIQSYSMTPRRMDNSFTGKGSGNGQMTYDAAKKIITGYSLKTELSMNKKLDYFEFDLKTTNEFSQQTDLETK